MSPGSSTAHRRKDQCHASRSRSVCSSTSSTSTSCTTRSSTARPSGSRRACIAGSRTLSSTSPRPRSDRTRGTSAASSREPRPVCSARTPSRSPRASPSSPLSSWLLGDPTGDTWRRPARNHAAPESTLALSKADQPCCGRVRPLAWCSRARHPPASPAGSPMTTVLIVLPLAAALIIWVLPLNDVSAGALALLAALAEVGVWIQLVARFDFGEGGLQFSQQWNWFSDLHVSYHVGVYGFSVWLIGLTVVAMAVAIAYGSWAV